MKNKLIIAILFLVPCYSFSQSHEIKNLVDSFLLEFKVPGIAISIIRPDTIFCHVAGVKKRGGEDTIALDSKFHLGSNTKAITAFIAAKLVEQGKVKWNSKLIDIVPSLKFIIRKEYLDLTLEELLSHRSGVEGFEEENSREFKDLKKEGNYPLDKMAFAKFALSRKAVTLKNDAFHYSNGGYIIAGLILEKVTGKSFDQLVLNYLGALHFDAIVGFPNEKNKNETSGHRPNIFPFSILRKYRIIPPLNNYRVDHYFGPAGDVSMNILDFSKFVQLHLQGLLGFNNYLSSATYQKLHYENNGYSLGWYNGFIGKSQERFSYHGGSTGIFSSMVLLSADREIGIVILVNAEGKKIQQLKNQLRESVWNKYSRKKGK